MRYGVTFNSIGQVIPKGLHLHNNLALYPYVPHPGQLAGVIPMPILGAKMIAGTGRASGFMQAISGQNANMSRNPLRK